MLMCTRNLRVLLSSLFVLLVAAALQGCLTVGSDRSLEKLNATPPTTGTRGGSCCAMARGAPKQTALARTAVSLVGRSRVKVGGRQYRADCSGFVQAVYASQRVDVYDGLGELDGGNGVGRIYTHVLQNGRIHYGPTVHPGDLVFFHNTWDFNYDGLPNDPLTHVGVVEKVERDGTVLFVSWVSTGVQRYRMNLQQPDVHKSAKGRVLNDYMRRKGRNDPETTRYLTGQLFAAFGTVVR